jgi:hypothetical protein
MRTIRLVALGLLLAASACAAANGGGCHVQGDCASDKCCLTCGIGPCGANNVGVCCAGTCDADGNCPAGSTCDGGICI